MSDSAAANSPGRAQALRRASPERNRPAWKTWGDEKRVVSLRRTAAARDFVQDRKGQGLRASYTTCTEHERLPTSTQCAVRGGIEEAETLEPSRWQVKR